MFQYGVLLPGLRGLSRMFLAKYSAHSSYPALLPREDSKTEVTPRIVWVKIDQSLRNRLLLWSPPSVIQSVAPVFHHHRLSRQDRLGVRGEHFGTPKVLLRLIHSDLRR